MLLAAVPFEPFSNYGPLLLVCGFGVGTLGTLVGAGGGFLLVPLLLILLPGESADRITALSMAVVFSNALSGTLAYARMGRIDWRTGKRFTVVAIPGAFLGAWATAYISRQVFELIFGCGLILIALFLLLRARPRKEVTPSENPGNLPTHLDGYPLQGFYLNARGMRLGSYLSGGVGFISSILGIGGGIIHVPALVYLLGYPVHVATATSHFVLAATSAVAVGEHAMHNSYEGFAWPLLALGFGAFLGAQLGARLSRHMKGQAILICLALALIFVGLRIVIKAL